MKKVLGTTLLGLFVLALTSCGGRHICDAYGGQADMTKIKKEHSEKMALVQEMSEAQK